MNIVPFLVAPYCFRAVAVQALREDISRLGGEVESVMAAPEDAMQCRSVKLETGNTEVELCLVAQPSMLPLPARTPCLLRGNSDR